MKLLVLKIILGIFSIVPSVTFILFFVIVGVGKETTNVPLTILGFLTAFCMIGLTIFYIINITEGSPTVGKNQKGLWAIILFFVNFVAFPIYSCRLEKNKNQSGNGFSLIRQFQTKL